MGSSTNKKVVLERFDRATLTGFVSPHKYLRSSGVEVLSTSGNVAVIPYDEIKTVRFVKDFTDADQTMSKKLFHGRPKLNGLWVRLEFRDHEQLDGILSNNLLQLEPYGFHITPPDMAVAQRVFVPKAALTEVQVMGVVGSPLRQKRVPKKPVLEKGQLEMFADQ